MSHSELDTTEFFNETVLDQLPLGVIVLDQAGYVVKYNSFEEQFARRNRHDVIGRSFFHDVAVCTDVSDVRGVFEEHIASNDLNSDIEFAFPLPFLPRPREVRLILRSFELSNANFAILLVEDISDKKDLERDKEALLRVLLHDLNNPLQGILGYSSLLEDGVLGELSGKEQREAISAIRRSSDRLKDLIDGAGRDLRGKQRRRRAVNLHALVLSSIGNLLPEAKRRSVEIHYQGDVFHRAEFPRKAVRITGAVDQLASMVQNLLSNAVKYAESKVILTLEERDGTARLEVADDGRGISDALQETIFDQGFQAPGSLPGQGLGLFSVRRVVADHEGTVEVESAPGEGALFRVVLPSG